ncbi:hypothetical protein SAMN02745216_01758 [Desulfatibacillum alkenivorans DSM 16219]|jgi:hypothetical protein|uniref:Uncharacterized protein n=1 Tax=Desulfatibacillum alkenivorans DSM 16219 TaxID=1121393 RepID=A0A1M6JSF6_9BACT|nr:hypothetical protein [Desulfatibacillum alkenivorans]SHJ49621.1 hypothetical protein SAMN02745216_01758 [Desulfatibacillum alkenivorans DSM 16219]
MAERSKSIFFDDKDHELLEIVNGVIARGETVSVPGGAFYDHFHPNGIMEMAESRGLRLAHAVVILLQSLEVGGLEDRLRALRYLRVAVYSMSVGPMPQNTARVLLQITKELVRAQGDYQRQLELARDFRMTATGKPRKVRQQLRKYHLLEMPEEWNQIAFDDHVHDSSTKGRKSPTHLIMDAWIKGIRRLRIIQYNYVEPRAAAELMEAGKIMGMDVRIGIEYAAKFRDKYIYLIWRPRGFADVQSFLCFLAEPEIADFLAQGKKVAQYQKEHVLEVLDNFNSKHIPALEKTLGVRMTALGHRDFLEFVGSAQVSLLHLARFVHMNLLPLMQKRTEALRREYAEASDSRKQVIEALVEEMDRLDMEAIYQQHLEPMANPCLADSQQVCRIGNVPELLTLTPSELVHRLDRLHRDYRLTLNLSNLEAVDVLELLYDCEGLITRLEIFNLKDFDKGQTHHTAGINELQRALNTDNPIKLKKVINKISNSVRASDKPDKEDLLTKLDAILHDLESYNALYSGRPLKPRIGSDSTGLSPHVHGMGLVIRETLPDRMQKHLKHDRDPIRVTIPLRMEVWKRTTFVPPHGANLPLRLIRKIPGLRSIGCLKVNDWVVQQNTVRTVEPGNIVTLGGLPKTRKNGLSLNPPEKKPPKMPSLRYLSTPLLNFLKVFIGFIPAFLTFFLTKDWWLLAYFGALIWFSITGFRNIVQSVLGGGGLKRSPFLKWNDFVSWDRITDSLLFTGFSVPLLDYLVKTLLMDRTLGLNTTTNPLALYAVMGLVNGIYISGHNILRGLPRAAATGNFFRSILSIPVAFFLNFLAGMILGSLGVQGVDQVLQKWAAIISKTASDSVAGIIEGTADRLVNMRTGLRDYAGKMRSFMGVYTQLQVLLPEVPADDILNSPALFARKPKSEIEDLQKLLIMHSLDMLYFWDYLPRGRDALLALLSNLSREEYQMLLHSLEVLEQQKLVSQLFIDGLVGKNFAKALAFYLNRSGSYLKSMRMLEFAMLGELGV